MLLFFTFSKQTICVKSAQLSKEVTTKVFDRATGTLYLGLGQAIEETSDLPAIVGFERYHGYGNPVFQEIVPASEFDSDQIEFLALATQRCNTIPILAFVTQLDSENKKSQTFVYAYSSNFTNDGKKANSAPLKDANQNITGGIVALAANYDFIFAAVKPEEKFDGIETTTTGFGDPGSGIAVVQIARSDNNSTIAISQTDAVTANPNIQRAKLVDNTIAELKIVDNPIITAPGAVLHWDEPLQRLYIGMSQITTNTQFDPAGARSVIVARLAVDANNNPTGALTFEKIASDDAFTTTSNSLVVGAFQYADQSPLTLGVRNLRTMHTSTGKSYLIVHGGNDNPGNRIFALPLVNNNNTVPEKHGTLANFFDSTFTTSATVPDDLLTSEDSQANVGMSPLPLLPKQTISDIVVVGDTVFVSTNVTQNTNSEAGIFYSQAMFDQDGVIYRWTPWTKRAFPFYQATDGKIKFFDVDAANGKIWAVDGISTSSVIVTEWKRRGDDAIIDSLLETLNEDLYQGVFTYLDLDQSTLGLGELSPTRYTLFGGFEKVAFIKTSTSFSQATPFNYKNTDNIPFAQYVVNDFSNPQNYLLTNMPKGAGCVRVLEYSRTTTTNPITTDPHENYFFAGTQTGLYVFANRTTNQGFTVSGMVNNLNEYPFISATWKKIPSISGSIIDIKSSGNALYILTFETSLQEPVKNRVYKVNFDSTIGTDAMFTPTNIKTIAESSTAATNSDLSDAKMFFAIETITSTTEDKDDNIYFFEQLLLATNNGIYRSNTTQSIFRAKNQEDAQWTPVDPDDTSYYSNIFAPDNPFVEYDETFKSSSGSTVWPVQVADEQNCFTFEKSNIRQLSGSFSEEEQEMPTYLPQRFNAKPFACTPVNEKFETLDPISYFWSDGARRFFIIKRTCDPTWTNKLFVIPYDIEEWMVTDPKSQMLTDPELQKINIFYWIGLIGASGILLAGTDTGVVALE